MTQFRYISHTLQGSVMHAGMKYMWFTHLDYFSWHWKGGLGLGTATILQDKSQYIWCSSGTYHNYTAWGRVRLACIIWFTHLNYLILGGGCHASQDMSQYWWRSSGTYHNYTTWGSVMHGGMHYMWFTHLDYLTLVGGREVAGLLCISRTYLSTDDIVQVYITVIQYGGEGLPYISGYVSILIMQNFHTALSQMTCRWTWHVWRGRGLLRISRIYPGA